MQHGRHQGGGCDPFFDKGTMSRRWHPGLCLRQCYCDHVQEDIRGRQSAHPGLRVRKDGVGSVRLPGPAQRESVGYSTVQGFKKHN